MKLIPEAKYVGQLVLGRYRIVRRLAQGGMGVVYLGRLEGGAGFSKAVVIKRIIPDTGNLQESTARFIREAQILSHLQHPGIVAVLDFGEEQDGHSMVLEYVHGYDLGRWLKYLQLESRTMHWEEAVFVALRVLEALSYAHDFCRSDGTRAAVLHRDITPGNVLLDLEGRARLLDFGIARMAENDDGLYKTETGVLKGKVAFLAPELFASSPPSPKSDLYSVAVLLYQMLAGSNPFTAENDTKMMWRVIMECPQPLAAVRDDLPEALELSILTALKKDPAQRHSSAAVFAHELRRTLLRSEAEIGASLRDRVRADFNGDMPERLQLEPLATRDRAWRGVEEPAAPASSTPGTVSGIPGSPSSVTRASYADPTRTALRSDAALQLARTDPTLRDAGAVAPRSRTGRNRSVVKPMVILGVSMSAVMSAIVGVAVFYLQRQAPAQTGRFIVVENPATQAPPPAALPHSAIVEAEALPVPGPRPVARETSRRAAADSPSGAAALSQKFAREEGALEACFERHASALEGQPQVAVKFEVAASGRVSTASLSPSSLNATPLGQCLTGVALATQFGELGNSVRFTIPIRAHSAQR